MESAGKRLVVTGSSAGGIETLSRLLGGLSGNFPAPIVVAQHLDPRVESSLAAILAKRTDMHVISVTGREKLEPGTVYVVPANRHVEIQDGHVALRSGGADRPKPSVDLLFGTAAQVYGERLIAVVLSGMGSDGTAGVRAVKSSGGTVVIEDPVTAMFPSMPASLPLSMVDVVAPVERLGRELEALLSSEQFVGLEDAGTLEALLKRINAANGIDFSHYKLPTIKRRLARQIKAAGKSSLGEYLDHLERTPGEYDRLVAAFLINVTDFFRDPEFFAWLRNNAIAEIVNHARGSGKDVRLWSAGCATGEEAYSLAILIAEALGEDLAGHDVRIFATDIDEGAISYARRGIYPAEALAKVPPDLVSRYFTPLEGTYEVRRTIRDMTVFGQHDLAQRAPFPHIDLVLCRNVLIYFSKELQQRTLQLFAFSVRDGGFLALGKAEASNPLPSNFQPVEPNLRVFRRFGNRVPIPAPPSAPLPARARQEERARRRATTYDAARDVRQRDIEVVGAFLMDSTVGFVMVDERYDIAIINAAARRALGIYGTAIGEDLVHLVAPDSAVRLRTIIDAALRSEQPQLGGEEIVVPAEGEDDMRCLSVSCYPRSPKDGEAAAALLIVEVTELVRERRIVETRARELGEEAERLRKRDSQWYQRQQHLLDANRQLVEANVELRGRSEALVIGFEEATAATEEIETLNEEMQATNEELETLNEESQATIEELNATNDELEARTTELQDLLVASEAQRREALDSRTAFQALADALAHPMAVVGRSGAVLADNREFRELRHAAGESTVRLEGEPGDVIPFSALLQRAAAGDALRFSYEAGGAGRGLEHYRGTVSALAGEPPSGGLLRLELAE